MQFKTYLFIAAKFVLGSQIRWAISWFLQVQNSAWHLLSSKCLSIPVLIYTCVVVLSILHWHYYSIFQPLRMSVMNADMSWNKWVIVAITSKLILADQAKWRNYPRCGTGSWSPAAYRLKNSLLWVFRRLHSCWELYWYSGLCTALLFASCSLPCLRVSGNSLSRCQQHRGILGTDSSKTERSAVNGKAQCWKRKIRLWSGD